MKCVLDFVRIESALLERLPSAVYMIEAMILVCLFSFLVDMAVYCVRVSLCISQVLHIIYEPFE